jgi:hypothetical protein
LSGLVQGRSMKGFLLILTLIFSGLTACKTRTSAYSSALALFGFEEEEKQAAKNRINHFYFRVNELQSRTSFLCRSICRTELVAGKIEGCESEGRILPVSYVLEHSFFGDDESLKNGLGNFLLFVEASGADVLEDLDQEDFVSLGLASERIDTIMDMQGVSSAVCASAVQDSDYVSFFEPATSRMGVSLYKAGGRFLEKASSSEVSAVKADANVVLKLSGSGAEVFKLKGSDSKTYILRDETMVEVAMVNEYLFGFLTYGKYKVFEIKTGFLAHRAR